MAAVYWVTFCDERTGASFVESVSSADARTMKRADIRAAYVKARHKAEARLKRRGVKARATGVQCVG